MRCSLCARLHPAKSFLSNQSFSSNPIYAIGIGQKQTFDWYDLTTHRSLRSCSGGQARAGTGDRPSVLRRNPSHSMPSSLSFCRAKQNREWNAPRTYFLSSNQSAERLDPCGSRDGLPETKSKDRPHRPYRTYGQKAAGRVLSSDSFSFV